MAEMDAGLFVTVHKPAGSIDGSDIVAIWDMMVQLRASEGCKHIFSQMDNNKLINCKFD